MMNVTRQIIARNNINCHLYLDEIAMPLMTKTKTRGNESTNTDSEFNRIAPENETMRNMVFTNELTEFCEGYEGTVFIRSKVKVNT